MLDGKVLLNGFTIGFHPQTQKIPTVSTVLCADSSGIKDPYVLVYSKIVVGLGLRPLVTRVSTENLRSLLHYTSLSNGTEQQTNQQV